MSDLTNPIFTDEDAARAHFEKLRWPDGVVCPSCGSIGNSAELKGKTTRKGLYKCRDCRGQFTATIGTLYERSHIPLHKWLLATHLMCASKKGMSAHQLYRMLGFGSYRTAWFMAHRIREAMKDTSTEPMGGLGKIVEGDETYVGGKESNKHKNKRLLMNRGQGDKEAVFSLVERGGKVRSTHVKTRVSAKNLKPIIEENVRKHTHLMTDSATFYSSISKEIPDHMGHSVVNHSAGEYVRDKIWHTNTVENYFSILKRGITGTFHHVSEQHLGRYVAEFDYRYNTRKIEDGERAELAVKAIEGKRLTYQGTRQNQEAEISL